jgi:hypothetical protein
MAVLLRDALALIALVALFALMVNQSERRTPRWLRRRGYPPPVYLETKEGRRPLRRLMGDRAHERGSDSDSSD